MRETMDISGVWRFQLDAYDEGRKRGYFRPEWDTRLWREAEVPSFMGDGAPGMDWCEGTAWYRTSIDVPAACEVARPRAAGSLSTHLPLVEQPRQSLGRFQPTTLDRPCPRRLRQ